MLQRDYLAALFRDLEQLLPLVWGRRLTSVFLGGGTPSLLEPEIVSDLLSGLRARLPLVAQPEITLEANPGSLEADKFSEFRGAGINRLSLGVQSFNDESLQSLGRIHTSRQARRAIECIGDAGFDSYNIDLMFGLPGQGGERALQDLQAALDYHPPHLSLYQLTIEPNTVFSHHPPNDLPGHDALADMQEDLANALEEQGLHRYEVSAYARKGHQSRHNRNYWEFGDYLGIGAGAHSKITGPAGVQRFSRPRHPRAYLHTAGTDEAYINRRRLSQDDLVLEFMLNATRLREGFSRRKFEQHTGVASERLDDGITEAAAKGLLISEGDRVRATDTGFRFLSEIHMLFA
jgi:putative oxygen-independent coproporphyrinogen III oxidase